MNELFAGTNAATARVLARNGAEVVVPRRQACCGALHLHSGEREMVRALARRAVAAGGSLVIQECPPALKSLVDVWGEPPSGLGVMKSLKATYDPGHHLNPGRYLGGL